MLSRRLPWVICLALKVVRKNKCYGSIIRSAIRNNLRLDSEMDMRRSLISAGTESGCCYNVRAEGGCACGRAVP